MIGILCLGAALAAAPTVPGYAVIDPGTRVRLTFQRDADPLASSRPDAGSPRAGRVVDVGDRTFTVDFDGHPRPVEVDKASVLRLERSLGRRSRGQSALRAAGIGLLAGAVTGAVVGLASGDDQCNPNYSFCLFVFSAGEKAAFYGITLGTIGTLGGAVAGAASPSESWEPGAMVFGSPRVGVHLVPAGRRGAGVAVSLGF
jgi:hypothetical protein